MLFRYLRDHRFKAAVQLCIEITGGSLKIFEELRLCGLKPSRGDSLSVDQIKELRILLYYRIRRILILYEKVVERLRVEKLENRTVAVTYADDVVSLKGSPTIHRPLLSFRGLYDRPYRKSPFRSPHSPRRLSCGKPCEPQEAR